MSKIVISNIFSNISATLINLVAPLIVIPLLTSGLGISVYGTYVTILAKVALFVVLTELGFGMYLAKRISIHRDSFKEVSSLFWIFLITKLILFFISVAIIYIYSNDFSYIEILICALLFLHFTNITPILMGLENYKYLTKVQLISKSIMIILTLLMNFSTSGLEKALLIQVIGMAGTNLLLYLFFIKSKAVQSVSLTLNDFYITLKGCLPFYGAKLFVNIYQQSSTYFVSLLLSAEMVAIYSISVQLYKVGQSIIGAVARVLYTSTVKTKDFELIKKLTIKSILTHISILPLVYFYGEDILALIFTFDVNQLASLSNLLYFALLPTIISSYWGYPALAAIGKENYAHIGILVASISYFVAFGVLFLFDSTSIYLMVSCIIISELMAMISRVFFARKFNLL